MAEAKIQTHEQQQQKPKSILNILSHMPKLEFNPFVKHRKNASAAESGVVKEGENQKPNFVRFPQNTPHSSSSALGVEIQESSGATHNPLVIWQVYAVGGFIIVKWVWARWKERKERANKLAEDDNQSSDGGENSELRCRIKMLL